MELRITEYAGSDSGAILRLEGRVVAAWPALLEHACSELLKTRDEVSLDLVGVSFVDQAGVEVLRRLSRAGTEMLCASGPVASALKQAGVRITLDENDANDTWH